MRGRGNGPRSNNGGPSRSQHFESNGPDVKVRGNAQQVVEKYLTLAREAATAGDPVMAENYYQHAEHYYRIQAGDRSQRPPMPGPNGEGGMDNEMDDGDGQGPQPDLARTPASAGPVGGHGEPQTA